MENLLNFDEFLNESKINEGLASQAFNSYDTVDIIIDGFDDEYTISVHEACCRLLGENTNNVCRLDSESDYDDDVLTRAYDTMSSKFRGTNATPPELKNQLSRGESIEIDRKMHVVEYVDNGFVAYFFTSGSKF